MRIATTEELTSIDTWATGLGTVGSMAAVNVSFEETFDPNNSEWIIKTENTTNEDYSEITFTITYNSSVLDADAGTFNTEVVVKTFAVDAALVPEESEAPTEEVASE